MSLLLVRMLSLLLCVIFFLIRDEQLSTTELTAKLEQAFLCGLRCPQVQIRNKFAEVGLMVTKRTFLCTKAILLMSMHYSVSRCFSLSLSLSLSLFLLKVFDASIPRRLFDRFLYIMCSQNWQYCGGHFWIKQCLEVSQGREC